MMTNHSSHRVPYDYRYDDEDPPQNTDVFSANSTFTGTQNPDFVGPVTQTTEIFTTQNTSNVVNFELDGVVPYFSDNGPTATYPDSYYFFTYDFSGLPGGCLPVGASFYLEDFDKNSVVTNMRATGLDGNYLTTDWFDPNPLYTMYVFGSYCIVCCSVSPDT